MAPFVASSHRYDLEILELSFDQIGAVGFWTSALHEFNIDRTRSLPKVTDDQT
jgi:hypothetical protein